MLETPRRLKYLMIFMEHAEGMQKLNTKPVISLQNIGKSYKIYRNPIDKLKEIVFFGKKKFHKSFWALKNVSFDVQQGECIGIIGNNGSGKSTLLQLISGTLYPSEGDISITGRTAALLELGAGFNPEFTGEENLRLNASILGLTKQEIKEKYRDIADFADIGEFIAQPVKKYSSGMYVRLAFAIAVNVSPKILIIDEALSVGDIIFQNKCYDKLKLLIKNGTTLLFVSHDLKAVKMLANKVIYLKKGMVEKFGTPLETIERYFFDTRIKQTEDMAESNSSDLKRVVGLSNNIAFRSEAGKITKAFFTKTANTTIIARPDEPVTVCVYAYYARSVKNPSLSIIIQDQKSIEIGGTYIILSKRGFDKGKQSKKINFTFTPCLRAGNYVVTLRLEDRENKVNFFPIDKQVGIMVLRVLDDKAKKLIGMFDLQIEAHEFT